MFFHCNTLHRQMLTNHLVEGGHCFVVIMRPGMTFIKHHHPNYTPLNKVPDEEIKKSGIVFKCQNCSNFFEKNSVPPTLQTKAGKLYNN